MYGYEYAAKNDFPHIKAMFIDISVIIAAAYAHEYGHYRRIKHYFPGLKKEEIIYIKIFFIPVPTAVRIEKYDLLSDTEHISIKLSGIIAGFLPILPVYFYDKSEFALLVFLYLMLACSLDIFFSIALLVIKTRKSKG